MVPMEMVVTKISVVVPSNNLFKKRVYSILPRYMGQKDGLITTGEQSQPHRKQEFYQFTNNARFRLG